MKESLLTDVFWHASFFLALSALVIPLLRYFKIPVALGYLFAGIALGPYGLGTLAEQFPILNLVSLKDSEHVRILAELGIVLLLFVIGLELTPKRLWQMRSLVFGLGGLQVVITASVIGAIAFFWGNNAQVAMLLGLSLALSSTAIVTQWLHEQKLFLSHAGRSSFSILLLQDLAVIPILLLLTLLSADAEEYFIQFVSLSLIKMALTVFAIYFVGRIILQPVFVFANRHGGAEVFMALSLLIIVTSASIASMAGLSMALGAFIAGLLLADTEYRHEISSLIVPFKSMLLGIFFLSFGMGINFYFIAEKPFWLLGSIIGLMTIKGLIIFALCKAWKQSTAVAAESAILLSQAGEFGLLVVGGALTAGLMAENVGQFMLIVVGLTMLLAPITAPIARRLGEYIELKSRAQDYDETRKMRPRKNHVVILGYGDIGQEIADILAKEGVDVIGFEKNIDRVQQARLKACPVYFGDATKRATLEAAQLDEAACVIMAIDDRTAMKKIAKSLREINPGVPLIVRAHTAEDLEVSGHTENIEVISEVYLLSRAISQKALRICKYRPAAKAA